MSEIREAGDRDRAYCCGQRTIQSGEKLIWRIVKLALSILSAPYLVWYFYWPKLGIAYNPETLKDLAVLAGLIVAYHVLCQISRHWKGTELYLFKSWKMLKSATVAWLILSLPVALISLLWIWGPSNSIGTGTQAYVIYASFVGGIIDLVIAFCLTIEYLNDNWDEIDHLVISTIGRLVLFLRLC